MADVIARLQVDSSQYDGKLKKAVEQMTNMEKEVRRTGATFEFADKAEMEFVKSLGSLETSSTSAKTKMMEYTNAIASLTATYRAMTDEEKQSDFGKGLSSSIDELKGKAATLKDIMSDTNIEIKNLASDTSFTDGIGLMTRTIGASASAIVAWTGDSKEMEAVIKDLAKIGTTVAAVDQLTKAFQKQNLVLLKNPYVAAAAAVVALGVAIGKIIKSTTELSETQKALNEVQQKGMENSAQEVTRIEALNNILHDNTRSLEERKTALNEIQNLVPDYHGALTDEGNLINDNTGAINDYITGLQRAAIAQAAFDKMVELQKKKMNQQLELQKKKQELQTEQARNKTAQGQVVYAGTEMTQVYTQQGENRAAAAVKKQEAEILETDRAIKALNEQIRANDIASTTTTTKTTRTTGGNRSTGGGRKGSGGNVRVNVEPVIPKGSLAELEKQLSEAQKKFKYATTDKSRSEAAKEIDDISAAIDRMNGKLSEEPAEGSIAYMRKNISKLEKDWENAADDDSRKQIRNEIDSMSAALDQMTGKTSAVNITFTEQGISELGKQIKDKMGDLEFGSGDYLIAASNLVDFTSFENLLRTAIESGMSLDDIALREQFEKIKMGVDVPDEEWQTLVDTINEQLKNLGLDPIVLDVTTGGVEAAKEGAKSTADAWQNAVAAVNNVGSALQQIEDPAAKVSGIVMQAVANIALGFAQAAASPATGAAGVFGWIAAATAGVATMASTIAAIKSATSSKFASGGMVGGNSYSGDNIVAMLNSGEGVLTAKGVQNAAAMANASNPMSNMRLSTEISGQNLRIVLNNDNRARGGQRGFYSEIH